MLSRIIQFIKAYRIKRYKKWLKKNIEKNKLPGPSLKDNILDFTNNPTHYYNRSRK
jgi:hypothetical protein